MRFRLFNMQFGSVKEFDAADPADACSKVESLFKTSVPPFDLRIIEVRGTSWYIEKINRRDGIISPYRIDPVFEKSHN